MKNGKNTYNNEYLSNPICKFTPIRVRNITEKKNIVSATFFKLEYGAYKNFMMYVNGIGFIVEYMKHEMKDFTLRLFIDESIIEDKELYNYLISMSSIDLIKFECSGYKSSKNPKKHRGLFPTLIRYFPLFDFPNNDADAVIISDIDYTSYNEVKTRFLGVTNRIYHNVEDKDFFKDTYIMYSGNLNKNTEEDNEAQTNLKYPVIIAPRILGNKKLPKHLLIDYIETANDRKEVLSNYPQNRDRGITNKTFIFGVDEYIFNHDILNYLAQHKLTFAVYSTYGLGYMIYYKLVTIRRKKIISNSYISNIEKNYLSELIKFSMKEVADFKFENLVQGYTEMDKHIYAAEKKLTPMNPIQLNIFFRIYLFLLATYNYIVDNNIFRTDVINTALSDKYLGYVFKDEYLVCGKKKYAHIIGEYKLPKKYIEVLTQLKKDFGLHTPVPELKHFSNIEGFVYNSNLKQFIKNTNNFNKKTEITPILDEELKKINQIREKYEASSSIKNNNNVNR